MPEKGGGQQKTKELKVFSTQVVTLDQVKRDRRKLMLLHIIKACNEVSEKGLSLLISMLKDEKNIDLNYSVFKLGGRTIVKELQEDLKTLLYLDLIEVNPNNKKLRLTSNGQDFLEKISTEAGDFNDLIQAVEELKPKIVPVDEEVSLVTAVNRGSKR